MSPDAPRQRSRGLKAVLEIVTTIVLAVVLYVVIQTFGVQTYRVDGGSMETTLLPNQHVLVDKLTPRFEAYSRGDIVVFHPPVTQRGDVSTTCAGGTYDDSTTPYIKRVIGVPGDSVEVKNGGVFINGAKLNESLNGKPYTNTDGNTVPLTAIKSWTVPDGCLFVLGDHRKRSQDSREFGMVQSNEVIGRAWLQFWPLNTLGIIQTPTYASSGG